MKLLQHIVHQLNVELERLQTLRSIIARLGAPIARTKSLAPESFAPQLPELPDRPPQSRPQRQRRRSKPLAPRPQKALEARALANSVPAGPIVVSAQELARERELRRAAKPVPQQVNEAPVQSEAALDALTRDLSARWLSGSADTA